VLLSYLVRGVALGGTAAAQPGPFQAYLLSQTLANGWGRTLVAAFIALIAIFATARRLDSRLSRAVSTVSIVVLAFSGLLQL
jgi:threonine/homoserine/homoserine lactone efflux protein